MKKIAAVVLLALCVGCGATTPPSSTDPTRNLSAQGRTAYNAQKVVKALDLLRDVAIAGEAQNPPIFTTASTTRVVRLHESVVRAIGTVPNGWKPLLDQSLTELQKNLPQAEWSQVAPYVALLRALMQEVQ